MYKLSGLLLITGFLLAGCGAGGESHPQNSEDKNSSIPFSEDSGNSGRVILNGKLDLEYSFKPGVSGGLPIFHAVSAWSNASVQVLDAWGNILGVTSADINGNFSVEVPSGKNYFLRAVSGNLILKAIVEDLSVDVNGVSVGPYSTAVVKVLGVMLENPGIGDPGVNISGALAQIDVTATVSRIRLDANIDALTNALIQDIKINHTPGTGSPSIGAAGEAGTAIAGQIALNITAADTTAPYVFKLNPPGGAADVDVFSDISVTFSEAMAASAFNAASFQVRVNGVDIKGTLSVNGRNLIFTPTGPLSPGTLYTVAIGGTVTDINGNLMGADYSSSFTTGNNIKPLKTLQVSSGTGHSLLLGSDGSLRAWGRDFSGTANGGTDSFRASPEQVFSGQLTAGTYWKEISLKGYHNFGISSDGTLWAWGSNDYGQLGDGSYTERAAPVKISGSNWKHIFSGRRHVAGIREDGSLWAWGSNSSGQLGDGSHDAKKLPSRAGTGNDWEQAALGSRHTVAIKTDGTLWAWGGGEGAGIQGAAYTGPVQISPDKDWIKVAASGTFSMALKTDGSLWGWGSNGSGQLGDGTVNSISVPTKIGLDSDWTDLSTSGDWWNSRGRTMALKADGTLWAWGANSFGQLGVGSTVDTKIPVRVGLDNDWESLGMGDTHSVAIKKDGSVWTWGDNEYSSLGNGLTASKRVPYQMGTRATWTGVTAGSGYTLGLMAGQMWAWGENVLGQLGTGSIKNEKEPAFTGVTAGWANAAAALSHTVSVKTDGTLWAWGLNDHGQLGDGTNINRLAPVQAGTATNWLTASVSAVSTVALKDDGTLWVWGSNDSGELGNGIRGGERDTPVQVGSDLWKTVSAGDFHIVAIRSDGTLWTWGSNDSGQLGDGTETDRNSPGQIGSANNWVMVAAGDDYTLAIKSDHTLWAWGDNTFGQLGDGSNVNKKSPTQVGTGSDWISVESGGWHSLAIKADGTLWAWGSNDYGQLGDGTYLDRNTPAMTGFDTDWTTVSGGRYHSVALKAGGTIWSWGWNKSGQLGDGNAWRVTPGKLPAF